MDHIISRSFDEMISIYTRTLESFYPARGSTGFTEANQVHIYVNALIKCLDDDQAVSWLEFPWVEKKEHIDGFVFSPRHKAVFFIEAKCSGQLKLVMVLEFSQYNRSDSLGVRPPLY